MLVIPKIKKRLSAFLIQEDGRISKHALLTLGAFASAGVLATALASKPASAAHSSCTHNNHLNVTYVTNTLSSSHAHSWTPTNAYYQKECDALQ